MKKLSFAFILSFLFINLSLSAQYAYDDDVYDDNFYPGYLGDDFSLEGALEVFKQARSIEDFEFDINNQDRYVNNLDLNNDGRIDFIRVTDQSENRNVRLVVMQAILGRGDVQDVAVIAIEKTGRRSANLQIIGDEYLFGPDMIVEPSDIASNQNRFDRGPNGDIHISRHFVNVWYWPSVRSLFYSRYTYYRSPYYWGYYPPVWNPWRPYRYATYYDRCGRYRNNFWRTSPTIRIVYFNNYYRPNRRIFSPRVRTRYERCRPFYRTNRGGLADRGGRADRDRRTGSPRGSGGRSYTQTKPERRSKFDSKREKNVVYNRDTKIATPKRDVRTAKATREADVNRPNRDVRTSNTPRASKYDRPKTEVRSNRDSYTKRPSESRKPTKKADRRDSYSQPKASRGNRSSASSKPAPSRSSKGSYSSKSRSSSKPKASSRSNNSSRKSSASSAPRKSSSSSASRKPATRSSKSSSASKRSGRSSSKSKSAGKRGNKF